MMHNVSVFFLIKILSAFNISNFIQWPICYIYLGKGFILDHDTISSFYHFKTPFAKK